MTIIPSGYGCSSHSEKDFPLAFLCHFPRLSFATMMAIEHATKVREPLRVISASARWGASRAPPVLQKAMSGC